MTHREELIQVLVAQQWEKCKGELRALIALQGSQLSRYEWNEAVENRVWRDLEKLTNEFIDQVEANGLAE